MVKLSYIAGLGFIGCLLLSPSAHTGSLKPLYEGRPAKTYVFINRHWFDGQGFFKDTWYSVPSMLTRSRPGSVDRTLDLSRRDVVPPFGEANTQDTFLVLQENKGSFYQKVHLKHAG